MYVSISNLRSTARNANNRPRSLLVALLLIVKGGDLEQRSRIYYNYIKKIFNLLKRYEEGDRINIRYADRLTRRCFTIIATVTTDYEEQVKIIGVKSLKHCTTYLIRLEKREDLEELAIIRTHKDTKRQIIY